MSRIFIPRSVAETSMPYVINNVQEVFGRDASIHILTRPENVGVMSAIIGVRKVYEVNSSFFSNKTKILKLQSINKEDIVVMPITNVKALSSYGNVIKFIKSNFKDNTIYYHDFDNLKISVYSDNGFLFKLMSFLLSPN